MGRGRKPKPTALNALAPVPPTVALPWPNFLLPEARMEW